MCDCHFLYQSTLFKGIAPASDSFQVITPPEIIMPFQVFTPGVATSYESFTPVILSSPFAAFAPYESSTVFELYSYTLNALAAVDTVIRPVKTST